jgi:hypothetical protein
MSDQGTETRQTAEPAQAADAQQRGSIRLNYASAPLHYANLALVTTTPEEVILNFGVSAVPPTPEHEVVVDINNRIILSFSSAKRLALTLGTIISRYEEMHGVIQLPTRPAAPGPGEAR